MKQWLLFFLFTFLWCVGVSVCLVFNERLPLRPMLQEPVTSILKRVPPGGNRTICIIAQIQMESQKNGPVQNLLAGGRWAFAVFRMLQPIYGGGQKNGALSTELTKQGQCGRCRRILYPPSLSGQSHPICVRCTTSKLHSSRSSLGCAHLR